MLCPEVCDFKAPQQSFKTHKGNLNQGTPCQEVNNFYYNHLVSVVLPDILKVPDSITESLVKDCEYYKVTNLCLAELVEWKFVKNFIRNGILVGLSIGTKIDCDNCASITPTKKLILNLNKETYQVLGLEGKVSHFTRASKDKYSSSTGICHESMVKIMAVNPMRELEELRILYSSDMNIRTVQMLLSNCPKLRVLSELEGWNGISLEELQDFKAYINTKNFDLDIRPILSY